MNRRDLLSGLLASPLAACATQAAPPCETGLVRPSLNLVCDGDSITFGLNASPGMDWPSQLGRAANGLVRNYAVSSSTMADLEGRGHAVDLALQLVHGLRAVCLAWAGTNDIELLDSTPEALHGRYVAYLRKRPGFVVAFTMLPRAAANPAFEAKRRAFNAMLRRDSGANALVDCELPHSMLVDGVHPSDEGHAAIARFAARAIESRAS